MQALLQLTSKCKWIDVIYGTGRFSDFNRNKWRKDAAKAANMLKLDWNKNALSWGYVAQKTVVLETWKFAYVPPSPSQATEEVIFNLGWEKRTPAVCHVQILIGHNWQVSGAYKLNISKNGSINIMSRNHKVPIARTPINYPINSKRP